MMYIYFKITTWERIHVPEEVVDLIRGALETGVVTSSYDLWDLAYKNHDSEYWEPTLERLDDVDCQLLPEENGGEATIEFCDLDHNILWTNKSKT